MNESHPYSEVKDLGSVRRRRERSRRLREKLPVPRKFAIRRDQGAFVHLEQLHTAEKKKGEKLLSDAARLRRVCGS